MKYLVLNTALILLCGASAAVCAQSAKSAAAGAVHTSKSGASTGAATGVTNSRGTAQNGKSGAGADEPGAGTGTGWNSKGPDATGSPRTLGKHATDQKKNPGTTLAPPASGNAVSGADTSSGSRFTGSLKRKNQGSASSAPSR